MYTIQRITGVIAFVFIGWHVYSERFATHGMSNFQGMVETLANPYFLAFYFAGVLASSIHLGVGIWNFVCKWGLAATARAQRAAGYLGVIIALAFSAVGIAILLSMRFDIRFFNYYAK
jgi:succinate dehydrogenase / fumarate reductase cytochrome b subunit